MEVEVEVILFRLTLRLKSGIGVNMDKDGFVMHMGMIQHAVTVDFVI